MSDRIKRRYPNLGCSISQQAIRESPTKTPEDIADRMMQIRDAMDADEAYRPVNWCGIAGAFAVGCAFWIIVGLWFFGG